MRRSVAHAPNWPRSQRYEATCCVVRFLIGLHLVCAKLAQLEVPEMILIPPVLVSHSCSTNATKPIVREQLHRACHGLDSETKWHIVVNCARNNHAHRLHVLRAKCSR